MRLPLSLALLFALAPLRAQDKLPLPIAAKLMKIISSADGGSGKVACSNPEMVAELEKVEVAVDAGAPIAWADSSSEFQAFQKQGKIVVVSTLDLLRAGAPLAIVVDGGKPAVYISGPGRANSRIPGTVKKIARAI